MRNVSPARVRPRKSAVSLAPLLRACSSSSQGRFQASVTAWTICVQAKASLELGWLDDRQNWPETAICHSDSHRIKSPLSESLAGPIAQRLEQGTHNLKVPFSDFCNCLANLVSPLWEPVDGRAALRDYVRKLNATGKRLRFLAVDLLLASEDLPALIARHSLEFVGRTL
jgi:hypothetical protein